MFRFKIIFSFLNFMLLYCFFQMQDSYFIFENNTEDLQYYFETFIAFLLFLVSWASFFIFPSVLLFTGLLFIVSFIHIQYNANVYHFFTVLDYRFVRKTSGDEKLLIFKHIKSKLKSDVLFTDFNLDLTSLNDPTLIAFYIQQELTVVEVPNYEMRNFLLSFVLGLIIGGFCSPGSKGYDRLMHPHPFDGAKPMFEQELTLPDGHLSLNVTVEELQDMVLEAARVSHLHEAGPDNVSILYRLRQYVSINGINSTIDTINQTIPMTGVPDFFTGLDRHAAAVMDICNIMQNTDNLTPADIDRLVNAQQAMMTFLEQVLSSVV